MSAYYLVTADDNLFPVNTIYGAYLLECFSKCATARENISSEASHMVMKTIMNTGLDCYRDQKLLKNFFQIFKK